MIGLPRELGVRLGRPNWRVTDPTRLGHANLGWFPLHENSRSWNLYEVRVVLVEDDDDLRIVMAECLTTVGHDVRQAANVPQALSLVSTFEPEVMLIDIVLPVFDGNYLAAAIRRRGQRRPRLIAVTGRQERAQPSLFDAVLPKPAAGPDVVRILELATTGAAPDARATPSGDDGDDS